MQAANQLRHFYAISDSHALPDDLQGAASLLDAYKFSLINHKSEEAQDKRAAIAALVEKRLMSKLFHVRGFAQNLIKQNRYLESVAIFDTAAVLHSKLEQPESDLRKLRWCVRGMREAAKAMIRDDPNTKAVVRDHVIPIMREKLDQIKSTTQVTEQWQCLQVAWVLHHIEYCEYLVDQWQEREDTLKTAISQMRSNFGDEAKKHRILGHLLNNLGIVHANASRMDEASAAFQEAIEVKEEATDYDNEKKRQHDIEISENNMKRFERKTRPLSSTSFC